MKLERGFVGGGGRGLVAKSPSSEKTLLSTGGSSGDRTDKNGKGKALLLVASNVQGVSGVVMMVLGVLCAAWGAALARLGAGISGGLVGLLAGLLGTASALLPSPLYSTLYLATSLVSVAVNTLALVLTLTGVVRDATLDLQSIPIEDGTQVWAGQWCGVGLVGATSLHLLVTLLSLPLSCRRACSRGPGGQQAPESQVKQTMVQTWLGQHSPPQLIITPHLMREVGGYPIPISRSMTPVRPFPHHHSRKPTPDPTPLQRVETIEKPKEKRKKKREITEEELEKTYTGLDREIAEEFISIAMQPKTSTSTRSESSPWRK